MPGGRRPGGGGGGEEESVVDTHVAPHQTTKKKCGHCQIQCIAKSNQPCSQKPLAANGFWEGGPEGEPGHRQAHSHGHQRNWSVGREQID
jgi:hypothetical protein